MTTPLWITIISALVGAAVGWGTIKSEVNALRERVISLENSREKQGERIGKVESDIRTDHAVRRVTNAKGIPVAALPAQGDDS